MARRARRITCCQEFERIQTLGPSRQDPSRLRWPGERLVQSKAVLSPSYSQVSRGIGAKIFMHISDKSDTKHHLQAIPLQNRLPQPGGIDGGQNTFCLSVSENSQ